MISSGLALYIIHPKDPDWEAKILKLTGPHNDIEFLGLYEFDFNEILSTSVVVGSKQYLIANEGDLFTFDLSEENFSMEPLSLVKN